MNTKLLTSSAEDIKTAAEIIRSGGIVVFPTETVYGLGANALDPDAVKKIFAAKGRPGDNPLIVHVYSREQVADLAADIPSDAEKLMDEFWPGPLTVILRRGENVPDEVTAGLDTVGIRMPSNKTVRELLRAADIPVAAPSANISGRPSPTEYKHCRDDMDGKVDAIIDGGSCTVGIESTVIDMSGDTPVIYRPGDITKNRIEQVLGKSVRLAAEISEGEKPRSPGLKYKHYSPRGEVVILRGDTDEVIDCISRQDKKCGLILFDELIPVVSAKLGENVYLRSLGGIKNAAQAEASLFSALRDMDENGAELIFAPEIPDTDKWQGVRNRLYRAAGGNIRNAADFRALDRALNKDDDKAQGIKNILFVCTGNTCRSPMAEGILNALAKERGMDVHAESAGRFVFPGFVVTPNAVTAAKEFGADISTHVPRQLTHDMVADADLVLTMTEAHKLHIQKGISHGERQKIFSLKGFVGESGDVSDPFGGDIEVYKACAREIKELIDKVLDKNNYDKISTTDRGQA